MNIVLEVSRLNLFVQFQLEIISNQTTATAQHMLLLKLETQFEITFHQSTAAAAANTKRPVTQMPRLKKFHIYLFNRRTSLNDVEQERKTNNSLLISCLYLLLSS